MTGIIGVATLFTFQSYNPSFTLDSTKFVICLDSGHPSEVSSGAAIQNGTSEVHVAWVVGLELQKLLEAKGYAVVMTKSKEDQLVKNKERARIANKTNAALMVRLHCDATNDSGFAIYYPDRQGTKDGVTGPSEEVMKHSYEAAEAIHKEEELGEHTEVEWRIMRAEIEARHGKIFKDKWLQGYFASFKWYKPDPNFNESALSAIERKNVEPILAYERTAESEMSRVAA